MAGYLLFIDTNILLDFYRLRTESGLQLLSPLDDLHGQLIMTYQVEMEFKKNRHAAIRESLKNLKALGKVPHAAFLADTQAANKLDSLVADVDKRVKTMRRRHCTAPGSLDTHLCYAAWRSSYSSRASIGV